MSKAFDRAMDEVARIWEASDRFDTKVLQFIGIVSAGSLATAAIMLNRLPLLAPLPGSLVVLTVVGIAAFLLFMAMALFSAIRLGSVGSIDPRDLAKYPHYLGDDASFEEDALQAVADAFDRGVNGQERKWRLFARSLWSLGSQWYASPWPL